MKTKLQLLALLLIGCESAKAQTTFWSETFEDVGSPTSGTRTMSIAEFTCNSPANYYFSRTTASAISASTAEPHLTFTNIQGVKFFAAMDIDRGPTCANVNNQISANQSITWSGINIAGKTGLNFRGMFGATTAALFQGTSFISTNNMDSMYVEYRIDGGGWTKIMGLYSNNPGAAGGKLAIDLDGDRVGDGTPLTLNLIELSGNVSGTGNTLDLRFNIFNNNTGVGAMAIDNFRLLDGPILSVTIASFEASKQNNASLLKWVTNKETNSAGFDIQRSADGNVFETIGSIASNSDDGNSQQLLEYGYLDESPLKGINLYRLVEKDKQGAEQISDIRIVNFGKSLDIHSYPNPVLTKLNFDFYAEKTETITIVVTDVMGKTVLNTEKQIQLGLNQFNIDMSGLSQGLYNVSIIGKTGAIYNTRTAKN